MGYNGIGDGIALVLFVSIFVAAPLAAWKLVDIAVWFFSHVEIGIK